MIKIDTTNLSAIATWDYQISVDKVKDLYVGSWRKISTDLLDELYQAKIQINMGPGNPHGKYTWKQYCQDAFGEYPTQRTVDTWLKRHEIGEEAWNQLFAEKAKTLPLPKDDDSLFIVKRICNKDGTFTVRFSVSEYPDIIFQEVISA